MNIHFFNALGCLIIILVSIPTAYLAKKYDRNDFASMVVYPSLALSDLCFFVIGWNELGKGLFNQ